MMMKKLFRTMIFYLTKQRGGEGGRGRTRVGGRELVVSSRSNSWRRKNGLEYSSD